jgi:hypothetical protein
MHHSPPNNTPQWRRAFVCHFVRSDAEMPARRAESEPLMRLR